MPENPVISLGGDNPFKWSVKVYRSSITSFSCGGGGRKLARGGQEYVTKDEAKQEGCAMMANMTAELEDLVNA